MATVATVKGKIVQLSPLQTIEQSLQKSMGELHKALPKNMDPKRVIRIVLTLLKTNNKLQLCEPMSVTAAVFQMAQLGLEPIDGQAYIIPYGGKAQFQIGYKGYVSLFYRHEKSMSLDWGVVRENDFFDFDKGKGYISHKPNLRQDRGDVYAYWVKATLHNGAEMFEVMSKTEVEKHGKRHSKTYMAGPWQTDFDSMALKTVLIQLMKLLPKSVEIQRAIEMDETIKTKVDEDMLSVKDETDWNSSPEGAIEVTPEKLLEVKEDALPQTQIEKETPKLFATDSQGKAIDKKTGKPI